VGKLNLLTRDIARERLKKLNPAYREVAITSSPNEISVTVDNEPPLRTPAKGAPVRCGYALTCKMRLPAVAATVEEARYQAREAGRSYVVATDIRTALLDYQIPSDEALQRAFQSDQPSVRPAATLQSSIGPILQRRCNGVATALQ
jgi:hypothetical protein